jgi:lipopolysaccharide biosynthesis glycosyltransferase
VIHVVFTVDEAFAAPLSVALHSLVASNPGIRVSVLHDGLSDRLRARVVGDLKGAADIEWFAMTKDLTGVPNTVYLPPAALFRILMAEVLVDGDRVIYIDCDTVVLEPIRDLTSHLGHGLVAAVRDAGAPVAAGPAGTDWRTLDLDPATPYFNSGVMVVDLDRWRGYDVGRRALDVLSRARPRWGDQCALNAVAGGAWDEVPRRWNLQTADLEGRSLSWAMWRADVEAAVARPAIIHFTERDKPWLAGSGHAHRDLWREWLARTPFRGWQSPRRRVSHLLAGVHRAVHVARG